MGGSGFSTVINFSECTFGGALCGGRDRWVLSCVGLARPRILVHLKIGLLAGHRRRGRTCSAAHAQFKCAKRKQGAKTMVESELFDKGLETRRKVLGSAYVDANLAGSDEFMMTFQRAVTELAWGYAWGRPGLDLKVRSILT